MAANVKYVRDFGVVSRDKQNQWLGRFGRCCEDACKRTLTLEFYIFCLSDKGVDDLVHSIHVRPSSKAADDSVNIL